MEEKRAKIPQAEATTAIGLNDSIIDAEKKILDDVILRSQHRHLHLLSLDGWNSFDHAEQKFHVFQRGNASIKKASRCDVLRRDSSFDVLLQYKSIGKNPQQVQQGHWPGRRNLAFHSRRRLPSSVRNDRNHLSIGRRQPVLPHSNLHLVLNFLLSSEILLENFARHQKITINK